MPKVLTIAGEWFRMLFNMREFFVKKKTKLSAEIGGF